MRIFSESSYKEHIKLIKQIGRWEAWNDGYKAALERLEEDPYDRDLRAGRISINEYRMLKYHLPRIEKNRG
jgi:hypothetical protein